MQFKHPELLYALFLLLIPIIVHLFQLRKFQKEDFTNVAFLKNVVLQTRKSSQLKKWLVLLSRILLLACLIIAFAQPFNVKSNTFNINKETVIYLDNSFSMQAKGKQGPLFKRAVQDLISNLPENETVSIVTNNAIFKNTNIKLVKNDLLQLDYSANALNYHAAFLKAKKLFKKTSSFKNLIFISDFQESSTPFEPKTDSLINIQAVQLKPETLHNIAIDSTYISATNATHLELSVLLKNTGKPIDNLPVSLYDGDNLIAKTSVRIEQEAKAYFSFPINNIINGKISIEDTQLQFDNTLFFNINKPSKINVLSISEADDAFLKRIYTQDEFNYTSTPLTQLNYAILEQQHLIILNELDNIPNNLSNTLKSATKQGSLLLIIPSKKSDLLSYNTLLTTFGVQFNALSETEKNITTINFSHPLYSNGVFEKQVKNFQYPKVNTYFGLKSTISTAALQFEDSSPFLFEKNGAYIITAPLSNENSNFKNSPLIVPSLYNIGASSLKMPPLYYSIGNDNRFDVSVQLQQDAILSIVSSTTNLIPRQQYFNNKVSIKTDTNPSMAGIYTIKNNQESIQNISYNYNRNENLLQYQDLSHLKHVTVNDSIMDTFESIKSHEKVNVLWKWFVIFALIFLIVELVILKYFK
ncbi:hypothetical protein APS56_16490 [Pseudalgibacter alginicilyticus]|uniref:Aerotolerance regulator N-terminal domain-containing protein n=1 Tax=Pseudalgibacter alginicilyticus TaxID=1736674 RepID=A0A0P0D0Y2_9FLAO|nr:BatA domain-containing protein [Pseudalgibacter alginicilyticus]ALJ06636.1 hypothetical protein APS56_16490 [Pseudalgibacter alginicilyticus]